MSAALETSRTVTVTCDEPTLAKDSDDFTFDCVATVIVVDPPVSAHFGEYALGIATGKGWLVQNDFGTSVAYCPNHRDGAKP